MENAGMDSYCCDLIMSRLIDSGRDVRYSIRAYEFVYLAFNVLEKKQTVARTYDFSAKEIVQTAVNTANAFYGSIAEFVLADMGIKTANDIGAIIFNLVDLNIFSKSEYDETMEFQALSEKPLFFGVKPKPLNIEKLKFFEDT
ncbi:MAG: hypothetical protein FWF51_03225 [Chitinivibrionia bacterium]|nr:hypothetical protein [Chitinivibrionia bacterium]